MSSKAEMLNELETMLHDIFVARTGGMNYARLARAHGYVDGYMRALLETGTATKHELLDIVASERERVSGPAMRPLSVVADGEGATLEERVDRALASQTSGFASESASGRKTAAA